MDADGFAHYEPDAAGHSDPTTFAVRLGHTSDVSQCLEILASIQRSTAGWERTLYEPQSTAPTTGQRCR